MQEPALKYEYVNTDTSSPGEAKRLIEKDYIDYDLNKFDMCLDNSNIIK